MGNDVGLCVTANDMFFTCRDIYEYVFSDGTCSCMGRVAGSDVFLV